MLRGVHREFYEHFGLERQCSVGSRRETEAGQSERICVDGAMYLFNIKQLISVCQLSLRPGSE